jgi:Spy/CpxP family protein refolding chaperone
MRRKIAIGTLGFMVLLAVAVVSWADDGPPNVPGPGQRLHQMGAGGMHEWGGPHHFEGGGRGEFGRHECGGRDGWERGGRHGFGGGEHLLRMAENPHVRMFLGLTDEQVGRLHKIGVEAEKSAIQTHADLELRHVELRELLRAENPDRDAIMQKLDEVNALRGKMEKQQVETLLSARSVLTPEQVKKVKTFMENRGPGDGMECGHGMERHGGMGRPGHGGPGGPGGAPGGPAPKPQTPPAQ